MGAEMFLDILFSHCKRNPTNGAHPGRREYNVSLLRMVLKEQITETTGYDFEAANPVSGKLSLP